MYEQADKPKVNKNRSDANIVTQEKSNSKQGLGFSDNRLGANTQRKLQGAVETNQKLNGVGAIKDVKVSSFSTQRMGKINLSTSRKNIVQPKKKRRGIWLAENEGEAIRLMTAYASNIDLEWGKLPQLLKDLAVEHAQDYDKGGIDSGEQLIFSEKQEILDAKRKKERRDNVKDDFEGIRENISDELALSAFSIAHATYVGGANINAGVGGKFSSDEFYSAKHEWDGIDSYDTISNFHSFSPQDKAEQGKGNVGDTLDTRTVQGNLICKFGQIKINVHVNIE
ncbi:hypothetical protein [Teredinibacter haidensis]|uniref:hypothetical protein n=1 Tax=Teredinibacter haidensis TaxID=2731755 RepID=UPI0009488D3C|nr:hypothetical protein [Teredinibacter haidensis]